MASDLHIRAVLSPTGRGMFRTVRIRTCAETVALYKQLVDGRTNPKDGFIASMEKSEGAQTPTGLRKSGCGAGCYGFRKAW